MFFQDSLVIPEWVLPEDNAIVAMACSNRGPPIHWPVDVAYIGIAPMTPVLGTGTSSDDKLNN